MNILTTGIVFAVVSKFVMGQTYSGQWPPPGVTECREKSRATDEDITEFRYKKHPSTKASLCFIGCMHKKLKFMFKNHTYNMAEAMSVVEQMKSETKTKDGMQQVHKVEQIYKICINEANIKLPRKWKPKGYCLAAKYYFDCVKREKENFGLATPSFKTTKSKPDQLSVQKQHEQLSQKRQRRQKQQRVPSPQQRRQRQRQQNTATTKHHHKNNKTTQKDEIIIDS